ncbi:MAG: hypothetical protein HQL05_09205 [Nitrospirae bacterium]|uniref:hypothetical protein n=1 Tax=Candidatus Magnetobacterium casense TaxID=1455061 RepID=UPI00058E125F|nr:hypothetical protein [Candidatus Magnetobacterium casensis]MBF0337999.1 hypothetical protein [Nitrospirota bacterium]
MKTKLIAVTALSLILWLSGVGYASDNKATTVKDTLTERIGKRVILKMDSGETLEGTVTTVGEQVVTISKLAGKDFYDAIIRMDKINSVVFKAREN